MKSPSVLYFLNFYNDVDHAAPIIRSQLNDQIPVHVICNSSFDITHDVRFGYFTRFSDFHFHPLRTLPRTSGISNEKRTPLHLWQKIIRELLFTRWWAVAFLKYHRISCVVCTWGRPRAKGIQRRFFEACKLTGVRTICIPHGQNIYKNYDVNSKLRENFRKTGKWPDFSDRSEFDRYIIQTNRHLVQHRTWGVKGDTLLAAGSPRFLPSWIRFNRELIQNSDLPCLPHTSNTRIVFFLPHWRYNVDYEATIRLIQRLGAIDNLDIRVKGHTRGDSITAEISERASKCPNLHWNSPEESPALIEWADLVINFGSSIAIEAIAAGTQVIYPKYLHSNETIYDDSATVNIAENEEQVTHFVNDFKQDLLPSPPRLEVQNFLSSEVFCDYSSEEDVIRVYRNQIQRI